MAKTEKNNITEEVIKELKAEIAEERSAQIEAAAKQAKKEAKREKADSQSEITQLQQQVTALETQVTQWKNDYLKVLAESENTKKRLRQDFEMHNKYRLQSFAADLLPAIDNLERAMANTEPTDPIYQGVKMIYDQLMQSFKDEGINEIPALGLPFDPQVHHAISQEKQADVESGQVIEVLQKGYKIKDRVLRASLVKISE